ncbi:hypothetical protein BURKHO8Y_210500 [Burkholderia sp. 8Y]|nr:hypothetical protein BURKHO8Y_210500 [Burkholderia sp. 8Y]
MLVAVRAFCHDARTGRGAGPHLRAPAADVPPNVRLHTAPPDTRGCTEDARERREPHVRRRVARLSIGPVC